MSKSDRLKIAKSLPKRELRLGFNSLRKDYLKTGRIAYLNDIPFIAAINLGYAIESYLKQGLIELGNNNKGLQFSHDLKELFTACKKLGLYNHILVSDDFLDYSNSLFQMRYPSSTIDQCLKAYDRNNVIAIDSDFILAYDDFITQLDEAILNFTSDFVSSSIVFILCNINNDGNKLFYHQNLYALKKFKLYHEIVKENYPINKSALLELEKGVDHFWLTEKGRRIFYLSFSEAEKFYRNAALSFKFPGEVIRDKTGKITHLKI